MTSSTPSSPAPRRTAAPWLLVAVCLATLGHAPIDAGAAPAKAPPPEVPPGVARVQEDLVRRTYDVVVKGQVAFLATTVGVVSVDVTDSSKPRYLGALPLPGSVNALAWVDDKLAVALGPVGLAVVDASKPDQLRMLGGLRASGAAMGVAGAGKLALVASGTAGLQVIDLSDPARPQKVAHWETPGYARAVLVQGDLVYLADGLRGVHIFRMKGQQGKYVSTHRSVGHVRGLALGGGGKQLLLAESAAGLSVVDVKDPARPVTLGRGGVLDTARGVDLVKSFALVADGTKGIVSLDISDPRAPRAVDRYRPERSVNRLRVVGETVYVANDHDGLLILRVNDKGMLSPLGSLPAGAVKAGK